MAQISPHCLDQTENQLEMSLRAAARNPAKQTVIMGLFMNHLLKDLRSPKPRMIRMVYTKDLEETKIVSKSKVMELFSLVPLKPKSLGSWSAWE